MREATKVAVRLLFFVGSYWPFAYSDVKVPLMSWSFVICLVEGGERKKNPQISLPWSSKLLSIRVTVGINKS